MLVQFHGTSLARLGTARRALEDRGVRNFRVLWALVTTRLVRCWVPGADDRRRNAGTICMFCLLFQK